MTTCSSCMMIELVMYGMMPSPKMANRVSAPPEKRFRKPRTPPRSEAAVSSSTAWKSTPGVGMWAPKRYRAMTARVKRIFPRRSGILNMFFTLENTWCSSSCGGGVEAERWNGSAVGERVALGGRAPLTPRQRDDLHATACCLDGFDGRLGEGVGLDGHGAGQLT